MSFRALCNDRCTIFERVTAQDADTGEEVETLSPVAVNVICGFQNGSDSIQRGQALQVGNNSDTLFLFPQAFEIKKHLHVVEVRGRQFEIDSVTDLGGRKKYLRLGLNLVTLED